MKYRVIAVRMKLGSCILKRTVSCEVNNLAGLRKFYKENYGADSVMFTYECS